MRVTRLQVWPWGGRVLTAHDQYAHCWLATNKHSCERCVCFTSQRHTDGTKRLRSRDPRACWFVMFVCAHPVDIIEYLPSAGEKANNALSRVYGCRSERPRAKRGCATRPRPPRAMFISQCFLVSEYNILLKPMCAVVNQYDEKHGNMRTEGHYEKTPHALYPCRYTCVTQSSCSNAHARERENGTVRMKHTCCTVNHMYCLV